MMILMGENTTCFRLQIFYLLQSLIPEHIPETPPPIIKTSNILYVVVHFSSIFLDIQKSKGLTLRRMKLIANECYHTVSLKRMTKI
jgi:hypothetical protein